jgi:uncharacterized protein YbjT (DUF2867 family)
MRILITGASGFIGRHLVQTLRKQHDLVVCVRNPESAAKRFPGMETVVRDFASVATVEAWLPCLRDIDVVINAVGIIRESGAQSFEQLHHRAPCALFQACARAGVKKVIQISALGADDTAFSQYHLSKKAADDCLRQLDLDWVVVKPSLVYGPGGTSAAFFKALAALPFIPVVDRGDQPIQPIHIDDLIATIGALLTPDAPVRLSLDAVGPRPITFKDMLEQYRRWLGLQAARLLPVPYRLSLFAGKLAGLLGNTPLTGEAIGMLRRGNTGDVSTMHDVLEITPRSLNTALAEHPAEQADRWHARLFFLRPLLRIALGLLWLVTGIVSLGLYPLDHSVALVEQVGITGGLAPLAVYLAALIDCALGMALLMRYRVRWAGAAQIGLMLGYSALITVGLPEYWLHPFGPVTKNVPLIVATLVMIALEDD